MRTVTSPRILNTTLGLAGVHQVQNAGLAVTLVQKFLQRKEKIEPKASLSEAFVEGLSHAKWPGRCQTVLDPRCSGIIWYLDGAHTIESLEYCMQWFVDPNVALRSTMNS